MLVSSAASHLTHVLGRDLSPRLDKFGILNHAGQILVGMRRWNWTVRPPKTLTTVGGSASLALPGDFTSLLSLAIQSAVGGRAIPSTLHEISVLRSQSAINQDTGLYYKYCITSKQAPEVTQGAPSWQLELWPTPTSAVTLLLSYCGGWRQLYGTEASGLSSDGDSLPIPDYCESLYLEILNCVALGRQRPESGSTDRRLSEVAAGMTAMAAFRADGSVQQNMGRAAWTHPDMSHIKDQLPVRAGQ